MQRKSHLLEDSKSEIDGHLRRPPYRRRRWQVGMLMFIVANLVGSSIQITTLPLPVLSTLQASGLVFNTICASLILSEPFTRYSAVGTVLVASGAVLIALFGALPEPSHDLSQLLKLLVRQPFVLWAAFTITVAVVVLALIHSSRLFFWISSTPRTRLLTGMAYGLVSGILSAHSLLVAKSAVELLVLTATQTNQFSRWQSWIILLALVFLALSQLYFLHQGLKLCSTSVLYPFVFCTYNIIAILDGLIYFNQANRLPLLHAGLIAIGTAILLAGVFALSWRLDEDPLAHHHPQPIAPNALTPGMGMLRDGAGEPDFSDEDEVLNEGSLQRLDEESAPLLLHNQNDQGKRPRASVTKYDQILSTTQSRRASIARAGYGTTIDEIVDELRDNEQGYGKVARQHQRRASFAPGITGGQGRKGSVSRGGSRGSRGRRASRVSRQDGTSTVARRKSANDAVGQHEALGGWYRMKKWLLGDTVTGKDVDRGGGGGDEPG